MGSYRRGIPLFLLMLLILSACAAPPAPGSGEQRGREEARSTGVKRITAAVMNEHPTLVTTKFERILPGAWETEQLVHSGLVVRDDKGELIPLLATRVPTLENGQWRLFPDGRMETTWSLKPNVLWHDGNPVTAEDLSFTIQVDRDSEIVWRRPAAFDFVDGIAVDDPLTITVRWRQPYFQADNLLYRDFFIIPRHLLQDAYQNNKAGFGQLSYWSDEFVGTGPFRLVEFVRGSHLLVRANDRYVLGRPKVDEIEVRYVPDSTTLIANVLAGTVDMSLGRGLSLTAALDTGERWREGKMVNAGYNCWIAMYPQFINPSPPLLADVQFRRALVHALDRQSIADSIQKGLAPVADLPISPNSLEWSHVHQNIIRYEYDPRRAQQLIGGLAVTRAADGTFRDAAGQPISVEVRSTPGEHETQMMESAANFWRQVGLAGESLPIPAQRQRELEWRATRPGMELTRRCLELENLSYYQSHNSPIAENRFFGNNISRYRDPEADALILRFFSTVPSQERLPVLGQILHRLSDQVAVMGLVYDAEPALIANRLVNVGAAAFQSIQPWNVHEWDVR